MACWSLKSDESLYCQCRDSLTVVESADEVKAQISLLVLVVRSGSLLFVRK